jgi:uncharacterized protein YdeI (YjbR/CyaY-like superfamily)
VSDKVKPPSLSAEFASAAAWHAWLAEHHGEPDGVWLRIAKKGSGVVTVAYPEVLDTAIAYGWIDGQRKALDETYFLQRFTPRRARSPWSKINRAKAEAMIAAGTMKAAGLAEVERARADGRWDAAYAGAAAMTVPADLQAELDARPAAAAFFAALSSQNRYAILYRLQSAKRPETRARRLETFVAMLERRESIY